jgi:hypothetical protein
LTNKLRYCSIDQRPQKLATSDLSILIAHDKGKPVVRQGRKAMSLEL